MQAHPSLNGRFRANSSRIRITTASLLPAPIRGRLEHNNQSDTRGSFHLSVPGRATSGLWRRVGQWGLCCSWQDGASSAVVSLWSRPRGASTVVSGAGYAPRPCIALRAKQGRPAGSGPSTDNLVLQLSSLFQGVSSWIHVKLPPEPKEVDRWTEKRALFGVYDNIGILGDFKVHPKDLITGPRWLRGWRGNELQRCIRKKQFVGHRMFDQDYKNLNKRIRFLYRRFNRTGKHR